MLDYCIILFYCFHTFIQGAYYCSIWALNNDIFFFVRRVIHMHKSSSSKAWMLITPTVGKEAALQPLKCQSSQCQRKHFTPPLVLLQGLLIREHAFLQVYVANPALAGDVSITNFQVPILQQCIFSGSAGFLFRNTKTEFSQIQVMIKEA